MLKLCAGRGAARMSAVEGTPYEMFPAPDAGEVRRTVGPIVKALADVVSPTEGGLADRGYRERLGIDLESADPRDGTGDDYTLRRRLSVHATAYLAREAFGCPGLGMYDFDVDRWGVVSLEFDNALNAMDNLDGVGRMEWDTGGRFAAFLSEFGGDRRWMTAAATIALVGSALRGEGGTPSRNDVLEEAHHRCWEFSREYLSQVCGEASPILAVGPPLPVPRVQAPVPQPQAA